MEVITLELQLLNHLFYYTEVSGGKISGTATTPFIGDLALTYALRQARYEGGPVLPYRLRPEYEEIRDWGYYLSVAKPLKYQRSGTYVQSTQFHQDGYYDAISFRKSAQHTFKSIRRVQGIRAGSSFQAVLLCKPGMELPPVLRVGTGRGTLLRIRRLPEKATSCWLNAFTARTVFDNLEPLVTGIQEARQVQLHYVLENYYLMKEVPLPLVQEVFQPYFDA